MPDYAVRVYQLNFYVQKYLPEIFYHFKKNKIPFDILYSKWLISIFSQYISFDYLVIIWTFFIIVLYNFKQDRWKAIIKFALIFLQDLQSVLLNIDLESLSDFLRSDYLNYHKNNRLLYKHYLEFKVTNKDLKIIRDKYYVDLAKEKLSVNIF